MRLTAFVLAAALLPVPAAAQYIGGRPPEPPAAPLAGTIESPEAALARNVRLLAINPRDYAALLGAGRAALRLGDAQAAIGFFGRAEEINANHWAPKAGQGSALAQMGEGLAALGMFEQAQALGATQTLIALDRGLAFDLLARQAEAQSDYRAVLSGADEAEARRRLALSIAISGRKAEALSTLDPLLARRDAGARRARAFILALGGDVEGARQAIAAMMPGAGNGFDPFLRRLPTLGPAQKAAAVHLGMMPAEGAALAALEEPAPAPVVTPPARVAAARVSTPRPAAAKPRPGPDRLASIESAIVTLPSTPPPPAPRPIVERKSPSRSAAPERTLASRPASDEPDPPARGSSSRRKTEEAKPVKLAAADTCDVKGRSKTAIARCKADEEKKVKLAAADTCDVKGRSKTAIARCKADEEKKLKLAAADTCNVKGRSKTAIARCKADEEKGKATRSAVTTTTASRIYVQLAGGANADMMQKEYARIRARKAALFRNRQPLVSEVRGWSRLLVGPFKDDADAQDFVNDLHAAKLEGFAWTAPRGTKLEKLASK
ncbi:SPOR domain-containing protein [Sphingomonas sp. LHG3406-1]|uniref:SPOR domain-containing protein n=1 Tax=Sphingomonas sp. LHG3406-1 TaxID=2804617 RepID=UPI00263922C8|nr:SPOR domain-containing protein [Sphingomonas sp. LHG3406-1]